MKKRLVQLRSALNAGRLVRLGLAAEPKENFYGFVVGLSDAMVLLHDMEPNLVTFDGYSAIPLTEVRQVHVMDDHDRFLERALALQGAVPAPQPDVLLADLPGLLSSVNSHFPLLALHLDRRAPGRCFIGRIAEIKKRSVRLREISPAARWEPDPYKYPLRDITRVSFGGAYEAALWMVAEADRHEGSAEDGVENNDGNRLPD
jgi:hypothetical protein